MIRISDPADLDRCAAEMAATEPWLTLQRTYAGLRARLDDPDYEVWGDEPLHGFIVWTLHGPMSGYIRTLCIFPAARGHGRGTALLRHAEDRILAERNNVFICVSSFNPRARALYERCGYRQVGELQDYIIPGASELLLRKTRGPLHAQLSPQTPLPSGSEKVTAEVREATEAERLEAAAWMAQSPPWSWCELSAQECLRGQGEQALVACVKGQARALAGYRTNGPFPTYLHTLCVEPGWSGRSLGSQLLGEVERRARAVGPNVFLGVADFLGEARAFYRRHGYQVVAELTDYLASGCCQLVMRKRL